MFYTKPNSSADGGKKLDGDRLARGIGFSKWMQLSDEDFYVIREKDILTISAMSKQCIFMYESYLKGESSDSRREKMEQDPNKHLGYLGSMIMQELYLKKYIKVNNIFRNLYTV